MKVSVSTRLLLCFAAAMPLVLTAACGQKGALYLPPRGTVVTRPAGAGGTPPQSSSPQDSGSKQPGDKNDENNPQNPQAPKQP